MTRLLALLALLLPATAAAQAETRGLIETLFGERPDKTPIPQVAWEEEFHGLYAVDGACDAAEAVWAFAPDTVEMGRRICTALGKLIWEDGWLVVPAAQCSTMGEPTPDLRIALRGENGVVTARVEGAADEVRLEPCPHPGG